MLIGSIRPVETRTVDVTAPSLEAVHADLESQRPAGFDLVSAPVRMIKGAALMETTGKFARRDEPSEIEAVDMDTLIGKVPDGWQLLSVRKG